MEGKEGGGDVVTQVKMGNSRRKINIAIGKFICLIVIVTIPCLNLDMK